MKSPLLITVLVYLLSVQPGKSATVDSIATPAGRLDNIYMGFGF
jgi:hypothetical protein